MWMVDPSMLMVDVVTGGRNSRSCDHDIVDYLDWRGGPSTPPNYLSAASVRFIVLCDCVRWTFLFRCCWGLLASSIYSGVILIFFG